MNKNIIHLVIGLVLSALTLTGFAGSFHSVVEDTSPAIRIDNAFTGTVSIVVTNAGAGFLSVTCDGIETLIDCTNTSYDTVAELAGAIVACTNADGDASLSSDIDCSLSADSINGTLLDGTYTAVQNRALELLWDTSACDFWSIYLKDAQAFDGEGVADVTIDDISGSVEGTGTVTCTVYIDGAKATEKKFVSPYYALPSSVNYTGTQEMASVETVNIDWGLNVHKKSSESVIIRATRATDATTGTIGASVK